MAAAVVAVLYTTSHLGRIEINKPRSGTTTNATFITVSGRVTDRRVARVTLVVNGSSRTVTVEGGTFVAKAPLIRGENTIQASLEGVAKNFVGRSNVIQVTANIPRSDIWTELTWVGRGDIDLHLPRNEHCFYKNPRTRSGAWLDIDERVSDGPEHILMEKATPGEYRLSVVYFEASSRPPRSVPWKVSVRLKDGETLQTHSGELLRVNEEQEVATFRFP